MANRIASSAAPPASSRNWLRRYAHWLHEQWPAGQVEPLPDADAEGRTAVPGLYLAGDLTGVPLLKFALHSGAKSVQLALQERGRSANPAHYDLVILGAGPAGLAAALAAQQQGLRFLLLEAARPLQTLEDFPPAKPIYAYPEQLQPVGPLQLDATCHTKEGLLQHLQKQIAAAGLQPQIVRVSHLSSEGQALAVWPQQSGPLTAQAQPICHARSVIVAIGRTGEYRSLDVPGEQLPLVFRRLHDPALFASQPVVVVGGGDAALEAAIALAEVGAAVTLLVRSAELVRPKAELLARWRYLLQTKPTCRLLLGETVQEIRAEGLVVTRSQAQLPAAAVFVLIGRQAPLSFFRRSGVPIRGDRGPLGWLSMVGFLCFALWLYHWKASYAIPLGGKLPGFLNPQPAAWLQALGLSALSLSPTNPLAILISRAAQPGFWYTLAYSLVIVLFGIARIRRRRTSYVFWQTCTLMLVQVGPLFLLPELLLPWLDATGFFANTEIGRWLEALFFPGKSWWRAYGFVLAWPLMVWNWFTAEPLWGWLVLGVLQTFVLLPLLVWRFGKGAYCGWICSCGALAETLGDRHRHKMPHGPTANRWNLLGQGILAWAMVLLLLRVAGWWLGPQSWPAHWASYLHTQAAGGLLSYNWVVDLMLAGVAGYGLYFWFSGRMWCRFACPLAALMHIYARFSRFAILAEKSKCISCNACTSICHQGIDVMAFAVRGLPMQDPQCVRCSACLQACPTQVLSFGLHPAPGAPRANATPNTNSLVQISGISANH